MELWKAILIIVVTCAAMGIIIWMLWAILLAALRDIFNEAIEDDQADSSAELEITDDDIIIIQATIQQNSLLAQESARRLQTMMQQGHLDAQTVTTVQTLVTDLDSIAQHNTEIEAEALKYLTRS